jgi:hypothetical protein
MRAAGQLELVTQGSTRPVTSVSHVGIVKTRRFSFTIPDEGPNVAYVP